MISSTRKNILKLIAFLTLIIMISCVGDHYHNIPAEEKFTFKVSDTLVYVSNLNNCDTFIIENVNTDYTIYDKVDHVQYQEISIKPIGKTSIRNCSFSNRYYSCGVSWGEFSYGFRLEEKDPVTCTINNRVFEKVYKLADNEAIRDQVDILYTYKYGVIQYRLPDDEIYILSFK